MRTKLERDERVGQLEIDAASFHLVRDPVDVGVVRLLGLVELYQFCVGQLVEVWQIVHAPVTHIWRESSVLVPTRLATAAGEYVAGRPCNQPYIETRPFG